MARGQRGKRPQLSVEEALAASTLVFRQAALQFGVSYPTWKALREGKGFLPFKGTGFAEDLVGSILESVRTEPHHNTAERARRLGVGSGSLQAFLADRGLSKLNARLRFAGYQVEAVRPLEIARMRRIVASRPGSLTHIDYKTFGFLRGVRGEPSIRLGGFVLIDSLTSYAVVRLAKAPDVFEAVASLHLYIERAPFELRGILLSDNGGAFLGEHFVNAVRKLGLLHRTIRPSHPWSNGKVEAMNKTLKYQCFAAIAGNVGTWDQAVVLVDRWMEYYNHTRSHGGHCNKGLPPMAFYNIWKRIEGDDLAKLIGLGIVKMDDDWDVRLLGNSDPAKEGEDGSLPFAFVMDRRRGPTLDASLGIPDPTVPVLHVGGQPNNFSPAR